MIIAHLPAGYLLNRTLSSGYFNRNLQEKTQRRLFLWGLFCAVLPDLDLIYFYFMDPLPVNHHEYWTHVPVFWAYLSLVLWAATRLTGERVLQYAAALFSLNTMGHMVLDTIVGKILWLYPWSNNFYALFDLPQRFNWWLWDFVFHWSFYLEIGVWYLAIGAFAYSQGLVSLPALPKQAFQLLKKSMG